MKKKIIRYIGIFIIAVSSVLIFVYISNPGVFNCYLVTISSDFNCNDDNLYISKDTPIEYQEILNRFFSQADQRVINFWQIEKRLGEPIIIYCHNDELLEKYIPRKSIVTYNTPLNKFIVLGKEDLDLDKLSHELLHTEFSERIGYYNLVSEIPTWFDEGLALQVDFRKEYSPEKFLELRDSLNINIDLSTITTPETFWNNEYYHHYLTAGYEVNLWLKNNKLTGLLELIKNIKAGATFNEVYFNERNKNENRNQTDRL